MREREKKVCLYILLGDITEKYPFSLYTRFSQIDSLLIQLRNVYQENFFTLMNCWHALATSHVIDSPEDLRFSDLKGIILQTLQSAMPGWEIYGLVPLILLSNQDIDNISATLELSGLAKAYGHPCIQTDIGLQTMREYACQVKTYKTEWGEVARSNFNYHFTKNFFKQHGRWPSHRCKFHCHPMIVQHSQSDTWPVGEEMRQLTPRDWGGIILQKELVYDYTPDVIDLL
jgi:hypothetical protein